MPVGAIVAVLTLLEVELAQSEIIAWGEND